MRVAVLGPGGPLTRLVVRDLSEQPAIERVVHADQSELGEALEDTDVAVGCWDTNIDEEQNCALECISARVPFISSAASTEAFQALSDLNEQAKEAGALVVNGVSLSPGMTNLMARLAAAEMANIGRIRISWIASAAGPYGELALRRASQALSKQAVIFGKDGWSLKPADQTKGQVFFPPPIGWKQVGLSAGPEVLSLPHSMPGVESITVMGGIAEQAVKAINRMPLGAGLAAAKGAGAKFASLGGWGPLSQSWSGARVDVWEARVDDWEGGDAADSVSFAAVDQMPNLLSAPLVAAALMVGAQQSLPSGVMSPESVLEPKRFFQELARRGVRLGRLHK